MLYVQVLLWMTIPPRKFFVGRYLVVFFADFWGRRLKEKQSFKSGNLRKNKNKLSLETGTQGKKPFGGKIN